MVIECYHFGHSFAARLFSAIKDSSQSTTEFLGLPDPYHVYVDGYSGLTFDRIFENPSKYLVKIRSRSPDILSVDIGTNDLCDPNNSVSCMISKVRRFLALLKQWCILPRTIVFCSVLQRRAVRSGQVSLKTFNHRAKRFNRQLGHEIKTINGVYFHPQARISLPKYLIDGVHLTSKGIAMYSMNLKRLFLAHSTCSRVAD